MFGGDEVSALVLDCGAHTFKAGYAGEDTPKALFPSVVGCIEAEDGGAAVAEGESADAEAARPRRKLYVGASAITYRRDNMEIVPVIQDGVVKDWELQEALWDHALRDRLLVDPREHPVVLAEPTFNPNAQREKTVELMFEKYGVPALFLAKSAVLTSFASGRGTSLVVDSGGGGTTVAAVHDGFVLQKSIVRSPIGGDALTECLLHRLESRGVTIKPRYAFKRKEVRPGEYEVVDLDPPNTTASFRDYMKRAVVADIKESVCRVSDSSIDETTLLNIPTVEYELPDGQKIEVGADRFHIPEVMFNPQLLQSIPNMAHLSGFDGKPLQGLRNMVIQSIQSCDSDIQRELYSSILLGGGNAVLQAMKERLEKEVVEGGPPAARVKVISSGNNLERRFSVWIGGSVLASLGSFQQLWLSKMEYEEHGAAYVHRKCP